MRALSETVLLLLVTLAAGAFGQDPARRVIDCLPAPREIVVDGVLEEWTGLPRTKVTSADPPETKDLSGEICVCHSAEALYVAGWVLDDEFLTDALTRWESDAVEVFFDVDLEGDRSRVAFDEDDFQIFVMPLNQVRRVEAYQWRGQRVFGYGNLPGIDVAARRHDDRGAYEFEIVIPFAGLGLDPDATRTIGFNVALNDQDASDRALGSQAAEKYILSLSGFQQLSEDTSRMCELKFSGSAPNFALITQESSRRRLWLGLWGAIAVLLLLGVVGVAARWVHDSFLSRWPLWRPAALSLFLLLGLALWLFPRAAWWWMERSAQSDLRGRFAGLHEAFTQLAQEPELETRLQAASDEEWLLLLQGSGVRQKGSTRYQQLEASLPDEPGPGHYISRLQGVPFLEYGIPIGTFGEDEGGGDAGALVIDLLRPERADQVHLAVAAFLPEGTSQIEDLLELSCHFEGGNVSRAFFTLDDATLNPYGHSSPMWGVADRRQFREADVYHRHRSWKVFGQPLAHIDHVVHIVPPTVAEGAENALLQRIVLSRNPRARRAKIWLSGITLRRGFGSDGLLPLRLGGIDRDGFPMSVREGCLAPQEQRLEPGQSREVALVRDEGGTMEIDRLRIYYRAEESDTSGAEESDEGRTRAVVEIHLHGNERPLSIQLHSGREVADSLLASREIPARMTCFLAAAYPTERGLLHYDGYELPLALETQAQSPYQLEKLIVHNPADSGGAFVVAGLSAAIAVEPKPLPIHPLLQEGEHGEMKLAADLCRWIRGSGDKSGFALVRDGVVTALGPGFDPKVEERMRGSPSVDPGESAGAHAGAIYVAHRAGRNYLSVSVPLPLQNRSVDVLLLRELTGKESLLRIRNVTALTLMLIGLPFGLLALVELLTTVTRIRSRLSFLFLLTSAAPLTVMFLVLANILVTEQREKERQRAESLLVGARDVLERLPSQAEWYASLAIERLQSVPSLQEGEISDEQMKEILEEVAMTSGKAVATVQVRAEIQRKGVLNAVTKPFYSDPHSVQSPCWTASEVGLSYSDGFMVFLGVAERRLPHVDLKVQVGGIIDASILQSVRLDSQSGESLSLHVPVLRAGDQVLPGQGVTMAGTRVGAAVPVREAHDVAEELDQGRGLVFRTVSGAGTRGYDLLTGKDGRPVAILAASVDSRPFTLNFGFTRIDLLWFVLVLGAVTLVAALFLGSVVTEGITRPLAKLQRGAKAIASGGVAEVVSLSRGDEVAELAQSFNRMSADLRRRIYDQELLAAVITSLTRSLDLKERVRVTMSILQEILGGRSLSCYLFDASSDRFLLQGHRNFDASIPPPPGSITAPQGVLREVLSRAEATWLEVPELQPSYAHSTSEERLALPPRESALIVPLGRSGRWFLLVRPAAGQNPLEHAHPAFSQSLFSQVAVALENARLYRLAVEDPETDCYVHSYFASRVGEEIERSSASGASLAIALLRLEALGQRPISPDLQRRLVQETTKELHRICRDRELIGRSAPLEFEILLPEGGVDRAREIERALRTRLEELTLLSARGDGPVLRSGAAVYPEDARSRSFLFDAARRDLEAVSTVESESVEAALHRFSARFPGFSFRSARILPLLHQIEKVAASNATVLILGETGTGKEVAAQLLHRMSDRADSPFVGVHCAALPEMLLESELFGHERGAFTGADRQRIGRFEQANRGTLFLDEVAEIPPTLQVKLLRVLQERKVQRLGATAEIPVDVRVVAATHQRLERLVEEQKFREDLYYRLKVVTLEMPPLRDRTDEIPYLVQVILEEIARQGGRKMEGIEPAALERLYHHSWPGNIRELKNVVQRAVVLGTTPSIRKEDLDLVSTSSSASLEPASEPRRRKDATADLNERQRSILELLSLSGTLTTREFLEKVGVSRRTALRDLTRLIQRGVVQKFGSRKAAFYRLKVSGEVSVDTEQSANL